MHSTLNLYSWLRVCRATDSFFFSIFWLLSMSACVLMHYDRPLPAHPSLLFLSFPQTHTAPLSSPSLSLSLSLHLCSSLWLSIQKEDRASCTSRLRQATLVVSVGFFPQSLLSVPSIPGEELSRIARSLIELACISTQRRTYGFWSSTLRLRGAFSW